MPARIVSLVPSHTETLFALGLGDRVVGRTRFCIHPKESTRLPIVGGTKDARADKVLALRPDLAVADKDENPKALVEELEAAGVQVIWSDIATVEDAAAFVERLGRACGKAAAARDAAQQVRAAALEARWPGPPLPAFCPIWHGPWMTFDSTAYPHDVLRIAGFANVFSGHAGPRYFEVTPAQIAASGAVATLLPTEPFPFHRRPPDVEDLGGAGRRVMPIGGEALTWFGVRTAPGLLDLARVRRSFEA